MRALWDVPTIPRARSPTAIARAAGVNSPVPSGRWTNRDATLDAEAMDAPRPYPMRGFRSSTPIAPTTSKGTSRGRPTGRRCRPGPMRPSWQQHANARLLRTPAKLVTHTSRMSMHSAVSALARPPHFPPDDDEARSSSARSSTCRRLPLPP